ncbi:hypothetical protein L195_g047715, partial [Trifolium pratense]
GNCWKQHAGCLEHLETILDSPLVNEKAHIVFFFGYQNSLNQDAQLDGKLKDQKKSNA